MSRRVTECERCYDTGVCRFCHGSGASEEQGEFMCDGCRGAGCHVTMHGEIECRNCNGRGRVREWRIIKCVACRDGKCAYCIKRFG